MREPTAGELFQSVIARLSAGDGVGAERLAKRLTILQPGNARAHFLLANSLCLQGRLVDAVEPIDRAAAMAPQDPDFAAAQAQLLARLQRTSLSIEWFRKAIALRPSPQLVSELAWALMSEGQPAQALAVLEQHDVLFPPNARPNALLARARTECGQFEQADLLWRQAALQTPAGSALTRLRSRAEACAGRLDVADRLLREAIQADPTDAEAFAELVVLRRITGEDRPLVEAMEARRALEAEPLRSALCYALGKSYHDLGEFELAMRRFDEANELQHRLSPIASRFEHGAWRQFIDQQIEFSSKERVSKLAREGNPSGLPIFVVGMIRSGTTLTEQILSCHPEIEAGGETTFWADYRQELQGRNGFEPAAARRLSEAFLRILKAHSDQAHRVTEKNPGNVLLTPLIHCVFPNAKFVHVKRHAVDNLLSVWMTSMTTGLPFVYNKKNLVFAYREYLRLAAHISDVLPDDRFKTFTYESLTARPEEVLPDMLSFLDLPMDTACLHPELNPRAVLTPSLSQARQPINTNSQAKWKNYEPWLGQFSELMGS